jgi:L-ascorbate metabolism protein UlaG (beta-lactamase superfamily)
MKIVWLGKSSFKIVLNKKTILFDADENVSESDYVFSSFSDYENSVYNLFSKSCEFSDDDIKASQFFEDSKNHCIFKVETEGVKMVHFGHMLFKPSKTLLKKLGAVDIAFICVGKEGMDKNITRDIMDAIGANLIIPMNYLKDNSVDKQLGTLSSFLKSIKGKYDYSFVASSYFETSKNELKKRTRVIVMDDK